MKRIFLFAAIVTAAVSFGEVSLTIYNDNYSLVKDVRELPLQKGVFELEFKDVASSIDASTVSFRSVKSPDKVRIFEQNYEYDIVSTYKLMEKYIDKDISVIAKNGDFLQGNLLSFKDQNILLRTEKGLTAINSEEILRFNFSKLPEELITRPTLVWQLSSDLSGNHPCEVSYMTNGLSWEANYVVTSNQDDTKIDLDAWVSINNYSGAQFEDANIKLVAGDLNRVQNLGGMERYAAKGVLMAMDQAAAEPRFEEEALFEYHLYSLNRPATVKDNQIKQLSLFPSATVNSKKVYTYDWQKGADKVRVSIEFENAEAAGLGLPLPAGKVRVFKKDSKDDLQFIGEDRIKHTPKNEKVTLFIGNAFDITAKREKTKYEVLSDRTREESYEVVIKNHKDEDIEVKVTDTFWGDWRIHESNIKVDKKTANKVDFIVPVKANGESKLNYIVRFSN